MERDLREIAAREPANLCGIAAAIAASAVVGAGASIYSSGQNAKAANNAANAQVAANQAAIGEQQREFNINQGNLSPWLTAGRTALSQQMQLLGLGGLNGASGTGSTPAAGGYNVEKLLADPAYADVAQWAQSGHGDPNTPIDQQSIADRVNYWIKNGQSMGDPRAINAPMYTANDVTAASPQAQQQQAIDALQNGPLYQSLMRNGQNTILANGSATGGLRGGNMQRSLADFGADTLASVIQNQFSNLGGLSGQGAVTGANLGQLGAGTSSNISSLLSQNGAARGGGILAGAGFNNAGLGSALGQLGNGLTSAYMLSRPPPGAYGYNTDPSVAGYLSNGGDASTLPPF